MICFWNSIVKDRRVSNDVDDHTEGQPSISLPLIVLISFLFCMAGHCEKSQRTFNQAVRPRTRTRIDPGYNQLDGRYEGIEKGDIRHSIHSNRVHRVK